MQNQLEMLRIFKVVAVSANFKEASVRLGVSPQAITRAIKELETLLGEPLFYRSTRNTSITEFGKQMVQKSESVIDQLDALFHPKDQIHTQNIAGLVKVTKPDTLGLQIILPALTRFLKDYPDIQFDLRLSNLIDNVVADQMDIGVRVGFFSNNRNVARRVSGVKFHIVGSPELIAKVGKPQSVDDLCQMPYTGLIDLNTGRIWPWTFASAPDCLPSKPAFTTDDPEAELTAVLAGIGFGQIADFLCAEHLNNGQLIQVLPDQTPEPWGIYVYRPQVGPVAERVRVVFDYLVEVLSHQSVMES